MVLSRLSFASKLLLLVVFGCLSSGAVVFQESFDGDDSSFLPASGWTGSYCEDPWRTDLNGGICAGLDDGCGYCGCNMAVYLANNDDCYESDPFDNHIQAGSSLWENYIFTVKVRNDDDDAMGVVFRYVKSNEFYLFLVSGDQIPDPSSGCGATQAGAVLYRIHPEGQTKVLAESSDFAYTPGKEHSLRVTVSGTHIKIEFDRNSDNFFEPGDVFFDADDSDGHALLHGKIGLYAYDNGAYDSELEAPCEGGGCYFDNVQVDLLPAAASDCGEVSAEGSCDGNKLTVCDASGEAYSQTCGFNSCCRYVASLGGYGCLSGSACSSCQDACSATQTGCSANLTHSWICEATGDSDGCLEPVYQACPVGTTCNPATGQCGGNTCVPQCDGKECGMDGCGGVCGVCETNEECFDGACVPETTCVPSCGNATCGDDGCGGSCGACDEGYECVLGSCLKQVGGSCALAAQCSSGLCLPLGAEQYCTLACGSDGVCPDAWTCIPWLLGDPVSVCAPPAEVVNQTCPDVAACVGQCGDAAACVSTCYLASTVSAQADYSALFQCLMAKCSDCDSSACYGECSMTLCFQDFANCYPGTLSCEGTLDCMQNCPAQDTQCSEGCYSNAMPAAKVQVLALFGCLEETCTGSTDPSCTATALAGVCNEAYTACLSGCQPQCNGAVCGADGCGGQCGTCATGEECVSGVCVGACVPECTGRECGDDGCAGLCGTCVEPQTCQDGLCVGEEPCVSQAETRCVGSDLYWFDSCGTKEELNKTCPYGCQKGACTGEGQPEEDVLTGDDAWGAYADVEPTQFGADNSKSGGCSAAMAGGMDSTSCSWAVALLLASLCAWLAMRRLGSRGV